MPPAYGNDLPSLLLDLEQGDRVRLVNLGVRVPLVVLDEADRKFALVDEFRFAVEDPDYDEEDADAVRPTIYGGLYASLSPRPRFVVWRESPPRFTDPGLSYAADLDEFPPGLERLDPLDSEDTTE